MNLQTKHREGKGGGERRRNCCLHCSASWIKSDHSIFWGIFKIQRLYCRSCLLPEASMAFGRQQLLAQAFTMLCSGSVNRWLSASAAHQHSQVPGCVLLRHVAAVHGIAACHQAGRHGVASKAASCASTSLSTCRKWHNASPAPWQSSQLRQGQSAMGSCQALPCSFQLPGVSHTSCSATQRGLHGWGVSNMPSSQQRPSTDSSCLQVAGAAQHAMAAVSSTGNEGSALFRKRPAEMTDDERMTVSFVYSISASGTALLWTATLHWVSPSNCHNPRHCTSAVHQHG